MQKLLDLLIRQSSVRTECQSLGQWLPAWHEQQMAHMKCGPFVAAVAAATRADRLAWAFFSGYQGAIQSAFPQSAQAGQVSAFCVNEAGKKISEIATSIKKIDGDFLMHGSKSWALADVDDMTLFVLARRSHGPAKGAGSLTVIQVPLQTAGVQRNPARAQKVVPELPHAGINFDGVLLQDSQFMSGDGYADYAKPFRAREDIFVTGCALAYLLSEAKAAAWPTTWSQRCIAALVALEQCSRQNLSNEQVHILVAGVLSLAGGIIRESEQHWTDVQGVAQVRWQRDASLLTLGRDARRQRAIKSWAQTDWTVTSEVVSD